MRPPIRRIISATLLLAVLGVAGWKYQQSLVPAIHPDHDHGLENIAGGGFLRVEAAEGGRRNLVGRPDRVLILHWFQTSSPESATELPLLVEYAASIADDPGIEVVLIATGTPRETVLDWARGHGVPVPLLYVDRDSKTAQLIGVRRMPETLIYDPEGHLAQQTRGPVDWSHAGLRAEIDGMKGGTAPHTH
jgi:hypothetical protein